MATVRILRSTTAAAVPSSLVSGQIAINESDGKLFYRNGAGAVTQLATGGGGGTELYSYATTSLFPGSGATTALYLSIDSGKVFQWTGSVYAEVGPVGGGAVAATVTIPASGDQYWDSAVLLLRGDGTTGDSSSLAHTVTNYGAAATGTAKFGANSLSFSGASSYLRATGNSAFSLPGDFTIEFWVYFNAAPSSYGGGSYGAAIMATYPGAGVNAGWQVRINGTSGGYDTINVYTGETDINWSATFNLNQWHHVAVTRSGSSMKAWVDGVQAGSTTTNTDSMTPSSANDLWVGRLNLNTLEFQLNGLLDDVRITKGAARYTAAFTPPAAAAGIGTYVASQTLPVVGTGSIGSGLPWSSVPASPTTTGTAGQISYDALGNFYICTATNAWVRSSLAAWETDASFASVSLLLNMEGSGNTFTDYSSSPKTITAYYAATQSAAAPKFGSKSLYLNGTTFGAGPYLSVPYSSAFDLSSGDWTVECWAYATALNASNNLFAINGDGASNAQVTVVPQANGSAYFLTQGSGGDWLDTTLAAGGTFLTNTWQHVAAVRAGNVFRLYVNGSSVVSFTSSSALLNASGLSTIGARLPAGNSIVGSQTWQGYIDDFRVTKGVARYSGDSLTVPTAAFPIS